MLKRTFFATQAFKKLQKVSSRARTRCLNVLGENVFLLTVYSRNYLELHITKGPRGRIDCDSIAHEAEDLIVLVETY